MREYLEIRSPMLRRLGDAPLAELRTYGAWFRESMASRIAELEALVQSTDGFAAWRADFTRESIGALDAWIPGVVASRRLTEAERAHELTELRRALKAPANVADESFEIPTTQADARTLSIAFDLGVYFGETFVRNVAGAAWQQVIKGSRRYVEFGHVVVVGVGIPFNPVRISTVIAQRVLDGKNPRFLELYDLRAAATWSAPPKKPRAKR